MELLQCGSIGCVGVLLTRMSFMANSGAAAAAVAVAILRSCPVCHPPAVANLHQPLPTSAPLLSIRGRHTVRTFPTTHWPPAMSIIPDIQPIQPPRSRSCGGQGVDGRWQMPLTMAQFCMQLTFTARCFLLSECGGFKGSKAGGGGCGGQWECG